MKHNVLFLCIFCIVVAGIWSCAKKEAPGNPDVFLVTIDTLRADYVGCYGDALINTPYIDLIAKRGGLFAETVSSVPITLPSHCTIMTGEYPPNHEVRNNGLYRLADRHTTLAEVLKQNGFRTTAVVGAMVLNSSFGLKQGFDEYDDYAFLVQETSDPLATYYPERKAGTVNSRLFKLLDTRSDQDSPRFFWVHYFDPHSPYNAPMPYNALYGDNLYRGEVAYTDRMLGQVFLQVEKSGKDNFWIITSDHGEGLGAHNESTHATFIYDTTILVPLVFSWVGHIPSSRIITDQVQLADIFPTILGMLGGMSETGATDGINLEPGLRGTPLPERSCYIESFQPWLEFGWSPLRGFRSSQFKYIEAPKPELYDLEKDPEEMSSITDRKPQILATFREDLVTNFSSDIRIAVREEDRAGDNVLANLKALGYLIGDNYEKEQTDQQELVDPKDRIALLNSYILAGEMLREGKLEKAQALFESILSKDPGNAYTHTLVGTLFMQKGEFKQAEQHFLKALQILPEYSSAMVNLGLCWKFMGQDEKAITQFKQTIAEHPKTENAYINLIAVYMEKGDMKSVFETFDLWESNMPDNPKLYVEKAKAQLRFQNMEGALASCDKAISIFPEYGTAYRVRGQVYVVMKQIDKAEKDLFTAYELDPENLLSAKQIVDYLFAAGRFHEAISVLQETLKFHRDDLDLMINYGIALAQTGNVDKAVHQFENAHENFPQNTWPLYNLGYINLQQGDIQKAKQFFLESIEKDKNNIKAQGMLGVLYYQLKDFTNAKKQFEHVLNQKPNHPVAKQYMELIAGQTEKINK